ncbi:MAG: hypothetical protein ACXWR1_08200 [Bdellovibrionota bacterium]
MPFVNKPARLAPLWIALLLGVLPAVSFACQCSTAGGFAPEGIGPDTYSTTVYGGFPSDFIGYTYCGSHVGESDLYTGCLAPVTDETKSAPVTTTQTTTDTTVANFTSAVETTVNTKPIDSLGQNSDGKQISSLASAGEVAAIGANQAATIGAVFCAQGANNTLTAPADAAALFASCQQNFDAANGMNGKNGGFNPAPNILDGAAAKQSLEDFEKNFGVPPDYYLHKMLGEGRGTASLSGMLEGKIPEAKLAEALEASRQLSPGDLSENANKFAVDLGGSKKAPNLALRDELKKKLLENGGSEKDSRLLASKQTQAGRGEDAGPRFDNLAPLKEGIFAPDEGKDELTIFDVVHLAYQKLRPRMRPGRILTR